ncbi:MAG: RnfABCDGE type electron transport complex subunit D [Eubacteriales bacterium]
MNTMLNLSSSPHVRDRWTTAFIMRVVLLALLPATLVGVIHFGVHALLVVLLSVFTAVLCELVFDKLCHKPDTWKDGSAAVTGLLLALSLSPSVPLHLPVLGSMFAILVCKCCFGGLGKNFINPALAGRCFLLISFGSAMSNFAVDAVSSATPVALLMNGEPVNVTKMFLGLTNGVIGSSALALLVGGLALWAFGFIHGQICFSVLAMFTLVIGLFGGQGFNLPFLLAHISGGGVIMAAFFMATDYVTSPVTRLGQAIYGCLIGLLGGIFRLYGGTADSFSYCVITGNLFTPLIDHYIVSRPYAFTKYSIIQQARASGITVYKRIPRPVVVLTVIAVVAGLALSGVYAMTKNTIDDQERAAKAASYKAVCPDADHFETDEVLDKAIADLNGEYYNAEFGRVKINDAFVAKDADGNTTGYALSVTTSDGYHGDITLAVGVHFDDVVDGISFTELNETAGLGMRVDEDAFKDQFDDVDVDVFKLNKAGGSTADDEIDSISGASTTSGAVVNAVNAALDFHEKTVMGGN